MGNLFIEPGKEDIPREKLKQEIKYDMDLEDFANKHVQT